jgi:hypothetical protein
MALSALARFVHVPLTEVARWIAEGLPQTAEGLVDPFVCSNWLCNGRLDRCPTLARRWRTYLLFFAPFLAGQDRVRQVQWVRTQRLYLPQPTQRLDWWLARAANTPAQQVEQEGSPVLSSSQVDQAAGWWHIAGALDTQEPVVEMTTRLRIAPQGVLSRGSDEHRELAGMMEEMVAGFRYEYRHHRPWEYGEAFSAGSVVEARAVGSCLDAALTLGSVLTHRSRRWRVVAGVVADSRIANPHFWIEVETTAGWAPLDPTLPAIVRMVGGDWRAAVQAWTGACDARRVTLGVVGSGVAGIPGGASCGSLMGEAVVDGINAWPCIDWVCGDCEAEFSETG